MDDGTVDVLCTCCPLLRRLSLSQCPLVTDVGAGQVVAELTQLERLGVRECALSDRMRMLLLQLSIRVDL